LCELSRGAGRASTAGKSAKPTATLKRSSAGAADFGDRTMPARTTHASSAGADAFGDRPMPAGATHACGVGAAAFAARRKESAATVAGQRREPRRSVAPQGAAGAGALPAPRPSGLWRARREAHNRLHLEEVLEPVLAPLAAVARLLVAAERRVRVAGGAVQVDHAGAQPHGDGLGAGEVARGDVAGQAVDGVVGDADRILLVLVADDGDHRAEDLLAGDGHVVGRMREDGRTHEPAALHAFGTPETAGGEPGALVDALLDHGLDLLELRPGGHGTHGGVLDGGIAHLDLLGGGSGER